MAGEGGGDELMDGGSAEAKGIDAADAGVTVSCLAGA